MSWTSSGFLVAPLSVVGLVALGHIWLVEIVRMLNHIVNNAKIKLAQMGKHLELHFHISARLQLATFGLAMYCCYKNNQKSLINR